MISMDKKYRTRDGREVRIYATDGRGGTEIHGAIKTCSGYWQQESWWSNGQLLTSLQSDSDLLEVKPRIKQTLWLNIYAQDVCSDVFNSKENADLWASECRVACVKVEIDCEEGEGL